LQTFESLTAGLILVSPEGRLSQMNASAREILGVKNDAVGKNFKDVVEQPDVVKLFSGARGSDETPKSELHLPVHGSDRVYEVQSAQVRNEEGKDLGTVAIFNDITEMKNIDRMKSAFVAMASHELRTPLTAIKGFVSTLLMDDGFEPEERREFYGIIDTECDRLTRLINDLLNTARIEANESLKPHYTNVNLSALLEKCVMIQRQATTRHTIVLQMHNEIPNIIGDEDKLDQVLTNLLNNAIKYSPNGGEIVVHATNEGENVLISVQDQGLGIPKDHLVRVFDKFHRVNNEDNRKIYGTGLGLFLVKHLVETVHMGRIWVESEGQAGKGSSFKFEIPTHLDIEKAKELNN
jgi:PAS domain S-box-containing protein